MFWLPATLLFQVPLWNNFLLSNKHSCWNGYRVTTKNRSDPIIFLSSWTIGRIIKKIDGEHVDIFELIDYCVCNEAICKYLIKNRGNIYFFHCLKSILTGLSCILLTQSRLIVLLSRVQEVIQRHGRLGEVVVSFVVSRRSHSSFAKSRRSRKKTSDYFPFVLLPNLYQFYSTIVSGVSYIDSTRVKRVRQWKTVPHARCVKHLKKNEIERRVYVGI